MRKLLYLIFLLPFFANAQQYTNGAKTGNPFIRNAVTDKYPVTYSALINGGHQSFATLAGRDSLVSYYPGLLRDGMQVYVRATGLTYRWNTTTALWEVIAYGDVTKSYVDDTATRYVNISNVDDIGFNSNLWRDKKQVNFYCVYNIGFPPVISAPAKPVGYFWMGKVLVDKTTNTGLMEATQWDIESGKIINKYERAKDDTQTDWGEWTRIWTDGALPLGTTGQSIRVNSAGTGFEAYTPAIGSGTVTSVSSANADISVTNPTTTPVISLNNVNGITKTYYDPTSSIQTQLNSKAPLTGSTNYIQNGTAQQTANYNINGTGTANSFIGNYYDFVNQASAPATPAVGTMRLYTAANRFGWIGSASGFQFRREIFTNFANNVSWKLPYSAGGNLADSAKVVAYTDTTAAFANLAHRNTNNTFTGNNTFTNNFNISGVSPSQTWTTTGNGLSSSWSRSPTLNTFSEQSSVYQPGAVGKSIKLNTDGRTSNYQYGTFPNTSLPTGVGTATFSICFWFRTVANDASNMTMLDLGSAGSYLRLSNGVFQYFGNGTLRSVTGIPLLNDGVWHYIVYSKGTGTTTAIYIDNGLIASTTGNSNGFGTSVNSYLGSSSALTEPFKGEFDGLLIYNYAIGSTEATINYNMNAGTAAPANQAALLANWPFDEGTGTTASTVNGSTRNITFVNNPAWNAAGKISAIGGNVNSVGFSHTDGQVNGEKGQSIVGDVSGAAILRGVAARTDINGKTGLSIGRDNNIRIDANYVFDPDALGSVNPYSRLLIGMGDATRAQLQFLPQTTSTTASANTVGGHWWDTNGRMNVVTNATTVRQYAYTSDVTQMSNYTASGNGSNTTITFAHGIAGVTANTPFGLFPHSGAAAGFSYTTIDATNVSIIYPAAPVTGTNNLSYTLTIKP